MAQRFDTRLKDYGCDMGISAFRELLADTLNGMYRGWNDEELMHCPQEALRYCHAIRQATGCSGLPDELILRVLSGMRKNTAV